MLKNYDNMSYQNWATDVRVHLFSNGYGFVWNYQRVDNPKLFLLQYTQRLKDQYVQKWRNKCSLWVNFAIMYILNKNM
jgi:hypothetical protein